MRNKVADYFVAKGTSQLSRTDFRAKVDNLADNVQLMECAPLPAVRITGCACVCVGGGWTVARNG